MQQAKLGLKSFVAALMAAALIFGALLASADSPPARAGEPEFVPIIFVHGFAGSGAQYQSQAMRFASNGYPADHIRVFDYNSLDSAPEVVQPLLDTFIDGVLAEFGATQAYMLGHSLGTMVMQDYLNSSPARAARVAKYINIDGRTADAPPGGVETLAIWGQGDPARAVVGAQNVYFPDQTHTQSVTSPESFAAQYEFFLGAEPATTEVEPETDIEIAGRAVNFPENVGIAGATLQIWEVDGDSGHRTGSAPLASYTLDATGEWGPLAVDPSQQLEFLIIRQEPDARLHHIYMQAYTRSNYLVRLLSVVPDSPIVTNIEGSAGHSTITVIRYKEWWGDDPGGSNDTLEFNDTNVINAAISPISKLVIGVHTFDKGSDGVTDLSAPDAFFFALPFQTGVDIYHASDAEAAGTICVANAPRGDASSMQVINVPNWPSSEHRMSMEFTDFVRAGDPACPVAAEPEPEPSATQAPAVQLPDAGSGPASGAGVPFYVIAGIVAVASLGLGVAAPYARERLRGR